MGRHDRPRPRFAVSVGVAVWLLAVGTGLEGQARVFNQETSVSGTTTALGGSVQLPVVSIIFADSVTGEVVATTASDGEGRFELSGLPPGIYVVTASLAGFDPVSQTTVRLTIGEGVTVDFLLTVSGVEEDVDVQGESGTPLDILDTPMLETLAGELLDIVPVQGENFDTLLPLLPGVVRTPRGRLSVKGGLGTQTSLRVNSVNVTDPVTGEFGTTLPDDAVETITLLPNPYAAEYGGFSAGVAEVETRRGTDDWRWAVTNFFPSFRFRDSTLQGIGKIRPRFTFSGPLRTGRVHLAQSLQYRIIKTKVPVRPDVRSDNVLESFDSFTQIDADLNDRHHILATVSLFPRDVDRVGVDTFHPREVSANLRQRGYNFAISERAILWPNGFLESGFAFKRLGMEISGSGSLPMILQPEENGGNFFNDQDRDTWTVQWTEALTLQQQDWAGDHVFKLGVDVRHASFSGDSISRPVEVRRADGSLSQRIVYGGESTQSAESTDIGLFVQDRWRVNDRLLLEVGGRVDRNEVLEGLNAAARFGFVWSLKPDGSRVVRSGAGVFFPNTTLNVKAFESYEAPTVTRFASDGITVARVTPFLHHLAAGKAPSSFIWNIEYFHAVSDGLFSKVNFLRRTGDNELILHPIEETSGRGVLRLDSNGRSRYWELELTTRLLAGPHELNFTYVRSQSQGDLNVFDDFFGNFRNPIIRPNQFSLSETDTKHRFLFRGLLVAQAWSVAPVVEFRQGFPFSRVDEDLQFVDVRNRAGRFPNVWVMDLDIQRPIRIRGFNTRVGVRLFHIFERDLPRDVQQNVGSPSFGQFSNYVERSIGLTFRIES